MRIAERLTTSQLHIDVPRIGTILQVSKNKNYPKCASCLLKDCDAGLVNHNIPGNPDRGACLFNCGCKKFVIKYDTLKKDLFPSWALLEQAKHR